MMASFPSELWLNSSWYAFMSSEAAGILVKVLGLVLLLVVGRLLWPKIWRHFECDVEDPTDCHRRGHPVAGTGHKACGEHHPHRHDRLTRPTKAEDILKHHEEGSK